MRPTPQPFPQAEHTAILEKYDKESKYRVFETKCPARIVTILAVGLSSYHLYTSAYPVFNTHPHRAVHVAVMLALVFLLYPMTNKGSRKKLPWYDGVLAVLGLITGLYIVVEYAGIVQRGTTLYNGMDFVLSAVLLISCWRRPGASSVGGCRFWQSCSCCTLFSVETFLSVFSHTAAIRSKIRSRTCLWG